MPESQEALKEDNIMVDLDVTGKAVDVELKDAKEEEKEQPEVEVKEEPVKEEKKMNAKSIVKVSKNVLTD
jgi:hypothetical protein